MNYGSLTLTDHKQFLSLLAALERQTSVIEIVRICDETEDSALIKAAEPFIIRKETVNKWHGTKRGGKGAVKLTVRADGAFFAHLRRYEHFFVNSHDEYGCDAVIETDFGQDDIAFLNGKGEPLFFTTTHEGYAAVSTELHIH